MEKWWWRLSLLILWGTKSLFAETEPQEPPDFWDQSVVIGVARAEWVYYHVTNLPRSAVLYCPEYPVLPEGYPDWPRQRLARPEVVEQRGQLFLRDPQVSRAQETERTKRLSSGETLWIKLWSRLSSEVLTLCFQPKPYEPRNYLFRPKMDEQFYQSTIFRYLPPDQFWQVCRNELILVSERDGAAAIAKAIALGKRQQKLVLALQETSYPSTPQTEDFWQPWSVFVRKESGLRTDSLIRPFESNSTIPASRWSQLVTEPGQATEQTQRRWRILRQTDLETGSYVDCLIDAEGQMSALWPLGKQGSLFQVWVLSWGTVRADLVDCWSVMRFPDSQIAGPEVVQLRSTGSNQLVQGQPYHLSWRAERPASGRWGLMSWDEDFSGNLLSEPRFSQVSPEGGEQYISRNPAGAEVYALWWKPADHWVLVSQLRQVVQPLPRVEMAWPGHLPLPGNQVLELNGHGFALSGVARVYVQQDGKRRVIKELVGKDDWEYSFSPEDVHLRPGRARLWVEYPAPWTSVSDRMETWGIERALDVDLQVIGEKGKD